MTRRLALVIVGVVIATLVLAGGGTFALAIVRARTSTEADLRTQTADFATSIADFLDVGTPVDTPAAQQQLRARVRLLARLRNVLPVEDVTVLTGTKSGQYDLTELPDGVTLSPDDLTALAAGQTVSGTSRRLAFAASQSSAPNGRPFLVVATRRVDAGLGAAVRLWFWAGAATILLGLGAAYLLGRRLSRPVREAAAAAHAIAAGELSTRVDEPSPHDRDELAELGRSINHMAEHLERNRTLEQQFLLSVSHDLRTPLTSIRGYSEAIEDGTVDPQRAAAVIRAESRRLERLVADLLDLAKLQAQSFTFQNVRMDLSAAVHTAVEGAAGSSGDITFHAITTGPVHSVADPDRVAQVLANLVENAGKYARTSVLVSCRAEHGRAVVTVDDDGPGIPVHDLPHVFERLYIAGRQPERKENSSGLGLAIVKELVESMGGEVVAGNAPTGGARLWFWLPASP
jgi:two-component system sensor histidine kinase BaeS